MARARTPQTTRNDAKAVLAHPGLWLFLLLAAASTATSIALAHPSASSEEAGEGLHAIADTRAISQESDSSSGPRDILGSDAGTFATNDTVQIDISPRRPGSYQPFDIRVQGSWPTMCVPEFSHHRLVGQTLELYFESIGCDGEFCFQVISDWDAVAPGITLPAGSYQVAAFTGCPGAWSREGTAGLTVGTSTGSGSGQLLIDDEDGWDAFPTILPCQDPNCPGVGFYRGGPSAGWYASRSSRNIVYQRQATFTYGTVGSFSYTRNNWARWVPYIDEPGPYEVLVHVPVAVTGRSDTSSARYTVASAEGIVNRTLSQRGAYGWRSLGTYEFDAGGGLGGAYVELRDVVADGRSQPTVLFDAVRWASRAGYPGPNEVWVDAYLVGLPDGASVRPGQRVDFCFGVQPAGTEIKFTYCDPGGCRTLAQWVDDGQGWCNAAIIDRIPGRRTVTIEALRGGRVVASDEAWFIVEEGVTPPDTVTPPSMRPTPTPTPTARPPVEDSKGTVLFVHGYQGIGGDRHTCIDAPDELGGENYFGLLGEVLLNEGFDVYVAEWDTGPNFTATVTESAECLSKQINELLERPAIRDADEPITIVAHSMGGLVSRRYLESALFRSRGDVVGRLITLGTPHRGIRAEDIELAHKVTNPIKWGRKSLEEMCDISPGICDLLDRVWIDRYNRIFPTNPSVRYHAIAGEADIPVLSNRIPGDDDGVVAVTSSEGVPEGPAAVARYRLTAAHTDFPHVGAGSQPDAYVDEADTICAVMDILGVRLPGCYPSSELEDDRAASADWKAPQNEERSSEIQTVKSLLGDEELVNLPDFVLEIPPMGNVRQTLPLDGADAQISLRWVGGDIAFELTSPGGETYDADSLSVRIRGARVERHALDDGGLLEIEIPEFEPGVWQLDVTETAGEDAFVLGFGTVRSAIQLIVGAPGTVSSEGGDGSVIVPLTAHVVQGSRRVEDVSIVAQARGVESTLEARSGGRFVGQLTLPGGSGFVSIRVQAEGQTASGVAFSRTDSVLVTVASGAPRLDGRPTLVGRDEDGNGYFDALVGEGAFTCPEAPTSIEGTLRGPDGRVIDTELVAAPASGGTCRASFVFGAQTLIAHGDDGPFTLDLALIDHDSLTPLMAVPNAAESPAYRLSRFEGPGGRPTPSKPTHAAFLPALLFGSSVKIDIAFGDGVDDQGSLTNPGLRFGDIERLCARQDWYDAAGHTLRVRWLSRQEGAFRPINPGDSRLNPDIVAAQNRGASVQCLTFTDPRGRTIPVPANEYRVEVRLDDNLGLSSRAQVEVTGGLACGAQGAGGRLDCIDVSPHEISRSNPDDPFPFHQPILQAVAEDGRSVVAWSDTRGRLHVTPVGMGGKREAADVLLAGTSVHGLVAWDDGFVALVRDGREMKLVRASRDGAERFSRVLVGDGPSEDVGSKWIDSIHDGRLALAGDRLAAYFGHTQRHEDGAARQGSLLWQFDMEGERIPGGWDWGCSPSLDVRLAFNGRRFGAVCLYDGAPQGISYKSLWEEEVLEALVLEEPRGSSGAKDDMLGGLVPVDGGFMLSFTAPKDDGSTEVGLIRLGDDATVGEPIWLTSTPDTTETAPHLAVTQSGFLAGWRDGSAYILQQLDVSGRPIAAARPFDAPFDARDDWTAFPNGDVGWAHAWGDPTQLRLVRITP